MRSEQTSVAAYIKSLPPERAAVIKEVRALVNKNLPAGYVEVMRWGMITWEVPLTRYPDTYNGQPLMYAALAAQKNYFSLYLMGPYCNSDDRATLAKVIEASGKKLSIGKSCIRFKTSTDLPLSMIGKFIKKYSVTKFISQFEAVQGTL